MSRQQSSSGSSVLPHIVLLLVLALHGAKVSSAANWGSFSKADCILPGYSHYTSRLWNIKGDWNTACWSMPATVQGTYFAHPDECDDRRIGGEWGEFYVPDSSCNPKWGSFKDDGCKGDGRRQFSSVLWGIADGESWEKWCANSWAAVAGVFFFQPTRCVNKITNMWGEFDVPDPCCGNGKADDSTTAPIHDQLRRRRLLADTCLAAGGSGGTPPHNSNGFPNTPIDACDAFGAQEFDADQLAVYLIVQSPNANQQNQFLVSGGSSGGLQSFDVFLRSNSSGLRFFPSSSRRSVGAIRSHSIKALAVPVTPARQLVGGNTIPSGAWYSISLDDNVNGSHPARVIATSQLSGCCLTLAWERSSRTLYLGHVQPDPSASQPYLQTGENLANHLRQQLQPFDGVTLRDTNNIYHIGANSERYGGYGATGLVRVNIIGLLGRNAIQMVVQFVNTTTGIVDMFRDMTFF